MPATCAGFCDKLTACGLDGAFDGCPCEGFEDVGAECTAAWDKVYPCMVAETCGAIADDTSPCWALYIDAIDVCSGGGDDCLVSGQAPMLGPCWFQIECPDEPTQRIECDMMTCTCLLDGAAQLTCRSDDACATATYSDKFFECCMFAPLTPPTR